MTVLAAVIAVVHAVLFVVLAGNLAYLRRRPARLEGRRRPFVSVLVPARDEAENLRRLLPSLLGQHYDPFEVVVYDDRSEDETPEVLAAFDDPRLHVVEGEELPPGWVGKVHALYRATRVARGERYLFLDADAALRDEGALARLTARFETLPEPSVMTGFTRLRGGGMLLVSLVPNVILTSLPWPLVRPLPAPSLAALNGQCWMIDAALYHRHEPHRSLPDEVLEDVEIGRFLKARGVTPVMIDALDEVDVFMYDGFADAWHGFRKNAYLLLGGFSSFMVLFPAFLLVFVLAPFVTPWLLLSIYGMKLATDLRAGIPLRITVLAPLSYALASLLQLHSAISHWTGRVTWKGRPVAHRAS